MHVKNIFIAGKELNKSSKALIMIHGRGSDAKNIASLASELNLNDFTIFAPEATSHSWYPKSFLAPVQENEPWLSTALEVLADLVMEITAQGIDTSNIYFLGFSQGACLTLEFVSRNATKFGGVVAFTGGLIGEKIVKEKYSGEFFKTPIFISTGNPDAHVPLERVQETVTILQEMNAEVNLKVFPGKPHNISEQEIELAKELVFKVQG